MSRTEPSFWPRLTTTFTFTGRPASAAASIPARTRATGKSTSFIARKTASSTEARVAVTAIWGVTFVQVQDAIALYPLFAFLAVRFAVSAIALAPFAWRPVLALPRVGLVAGLGVGALLAAAYGFQTAGLDHTTVASTGFITGLYVVFTPLLALRLFG